MNSERKGYGEKIKELTPWLILGGLTFFASAALGLIVIIGGSAYVFNNKD